MMYISHSFVHQLCRLRPLQAALATAILIMLCIHGPLAAQPDPLELFALDGEKNIMTEETFGIANGHITHRVNYRDVGTISGLFAPPYASSDFLLELRLFGEKVPTGNYKWYPSEVQRNGEISGLEVATVTVLPPGERMGMLSITLHNTTERQLVVPVQLHIQGGLSYVERWEFARPVTQDETENKVQEGIMIRENKAGRIIVATDFPDIEWFGLGSRWNTRVSLRPGERKEYTVAVEIGNNNLTPKNTQQHLIKPGESINRTRQDLVRRTNDLLDKLPTFHSDNKQLEHYYYRSLVVLLTNRWDVPEFVLHPYYGSGAVIGGCVGNYLWEFGLPAQIFPLYDPEASREHIKQFLRIDITKHFLFDPMTGSAGGKWYQVNQDKIIELIYYYVLHTGDIEFLNEEIDGRTVYEHVIQNALFGDDINQKVVLIDYGEEGENHLELRRGYPYHGIMPDVNALRYLSFMRAYELSQIAGKPLPKLPRRAEAIKKLLKRELWSEKDQWFYFQIGKKKDIRLTNFMFTLIGTGVFDVETEEALLSHLNEREFLGDYGIHSISKTDPAYDQVDIDHGGGGSYVAFPPLICQRLYRAGYDKKADDLLKRHLWWGERLPYLGDSQVANYVGYREDTPLQSDFSSISGAQAFIFGMFGVKVNTDGSITVQPHVPSFATEISLEKLRIRGLEINIYANSDGFMIQSGGKTYKSDLGQPVTINK